MDRKQSQFTAVDLLGESDFIPAFGQSTNKKITKPDLFRQIKNETQVFIYPTIEQLQSASLIADPDWPIYVRVEETEYRLYKITSLSPVAGDISLNNGVTATLQDEYSEIGFVVGPDSSTNNAVALFDGATGTQLKNGPIISNVGASLLQAPDVADTGYIKVNSDESITFRNTTQHKTDLLLNNVDNTSDLNKPISTAAQAALDLKAPLSSPVFTGNPTAPTPPANDNGPSIATTAYVQTELLDRPQVIENVAALSTFTPVAGRVYWLKEYYEGLGTGGGPVQAFFGSIVPNMGHTFPAAGGFYFRRTNPEWTIEQFGGRAAAGVDNTPALLAILGAVPWSGSSDGSGTTVICGAGAYEHDPIVINRPVTFKGAGKYSTRFVKRSPGVGFKFQLDTSAGAGCEDIGFIKKPGLVDSVDGHGVQFDGGRGYAKNIYAAGHGGIGILISDANSCQYVGMESISNGSHGVAIIGKPAPANNANAVTLINVDSRVNGGSGLAIENCFANTVIGCVGQGNSRYAVEFIGTNQFNNVIGTYSEANVLGAGRISEGSTGNTLEYNIVSDGMPTDVGTNNSLRIIGDKTFGYVNVNPVRTSRLDVGIDGEGAPGVISLFDTGSIYRLSLEGSDANATLALASSGAGVLTTALQALHNDTFELTTQNSWVGGAGGFGPARAYLDPSARVYLSGGVGSGVATAGTVIFQLPAPIRPSAPRRLTANNSGGAVVLDVATSGNVTIQSGTNAIFGLDGLNFHL